MNEHNQTVLVKAVRTDAEATTLLEANLPLSKKYASTYMTDGWPKHMLDDLQQEAAKGLWIACLTYLGPPPPCRQFTFWAKQAMRYEIQRFQREMGIVRGRGKGKIMPPSVSTDDVSDNGKIHRMGRRDATWVNAPEYGVVDV